MRGGASGVQHRVLPYIAKAYEVELLDKEVQHDAGRLPAFLDELSHISSFLDTLGPGQGFTRTCAVPKKYSHTFGQTTAPSLHLNVSVWRDGKNMLYDRESSRITTLAQRGMDAIGMLQASGMALLEDSHGNHTHRLSRGHRPPIIIGPGRGPYKKNFYYTINYRHTGDLKYTHLENRLPSASSDPYLAMTLTLGGLYAAICHPRGKEWIKEYKLGDGVYGLVDDALTHKENDYADSTILPKVLGAALYEEAQQHFYCVLPARKTSASR